MCKGTVNTILGQALWQGIYTIYKDYEKDENLTKTKSALYSKELDSIFVTHIIKTRPYASSAKTVHQGNNRRLRCDL